MSKDDLNVMAFDMACDLRERKLTPIEIKDVLETITFHFETNFGEQIMEKGTNEYVDEEDGRLYQTPERDPDRDYDDWKIRQLEEEDQQREEEK